MTEVTKNSIQFTQTESTEYKDVPKSLLPSNLTEATQSPLSPHDWANRARKATTEYNGSPFESELVGALVGKIAKMGLSEEFLPAIADQTGRVVAEADKVAPHCNNLFYLKMASFWSVVSAVLVSGGEIKDSSELTANIIDAAKSGEESSQWYQTLWPFLTGNIAGGIAMLVFNDLMREMDFSSLDSECSLSTLNLAINRAIFGFTGMNFVGSCFLDPKYARSTLSMAVSYAFLGFAGLAIPLGCTIGSSVMISAWDAYNAKHKGWLTRQTEKVDALRNWVIDGVKETTERVANCVGLK